MEVISQVGDVSSSTLAFYYFCVAASMLYGLYRFGINKHTVFLSTVYLYGFFGWVEYSFGISQDILKILIAFFLLLVSGKGLVIIRNKKGTFVYVFFILFSLSFILTQFANNQINLTVISQFILTYGFPFFIYQGYKNITEYDIKRERVVTFILYLVAVQVILSLLKLGLLGGVMESIVGSIQFIGGGSAVSLPILALFLFWWNE
jgi:hypothetical protein